MAEKDWLNEVHDACHAVSNVAYDLEALSRAFVTVGNDKVADDLFACAVVLHQAPKAIMGAISMDMNEQVKRGQEQTGIVLLAALEHLGTKAGLAVRKAEKKV